MIEVDVPQASGKMQRKLIWYMVYRVTNRGSAMQPKGTEDKFGRETYEVEKVQFPTRRFIPHFVLENRHGLHCFGCLVVAALSALMKPARSPAHS